jgi:hypothetical protein
MFLGRNLCGRRIVITCMHVLFWHDHVTVILFIEINHGGYFLGIGKNKSYVDGSVIWYDEIDRIIWSHVLLESIIEKIRYEMLTRVTRQMS